MKTKRLLALLSLLVATATLWATTTTPARPAPTVADLRRLADYAGIYAAMLAPYSAEAGAHFAGRAEAFDEIADWVAASQAAPVAAAPRALNAQRSADPLTP